MKRSKKADELCVAVDEIAESGFHLSCSKHKNWVTDSLQELKNSNCGFIEDIGIQLDFFKTGKTILLRGAIAATMQLRCIRCLDDFTRPLAATFHYNLLSEQEGDLPQEMEIPKEQFDLYYYSGAVIDIAPLVLEQIVLNIPTYTICQESCRGICQQCGADMNRVPCSCAKEEGAGTHFAALRNFAPKQRT